MLNLRTVAVVLAAGTITYAATRPLVQEMQIPEPTQQHIEMQQSIGEWEGTVTMHLPGMQPQPYAATETVRAAGPFWIVSDFKSEFMGMAYEGHGCHGFDAVKGKYVGTWIDNMSSTLQVMEGDHDGEMIVMNWDAPDMTGKVVPHRSEQKHSANAYTLTFFTEGQKSMVIDMKRKGATATNASAKKQAR